MWNIIIGFGLIIIGAAIGFIFAAMLTQSKIADEVALTSYTYEQLIREKCYNCEYRTGQE